MTGLVVRQQLTNDADINDETDCGYHTARGRITASRSRLDSIDNFWPSPPGRMDPICGFCKRGALVEDICGTLHVETLDNGTEVAAHHKCMQYSALLTQYKFEDFGGFKIKEVLLEIKRGKKLSCHICRSRKKDNHPKTGATSGCAYAKCNKSFHFYCANVDDTVITKRLVVNFKKRQTSAVLYRVFCSESHRRSYIEELRSEKEKLLGYSDSSDDSDDDDNWEDWPGKHQHASSKRDNPDQDTMYSDSEPDTEQDTVGTLCILNLDKSEALNSSVYVKCEKLPEHLASKVGKPISKRVRELQSSHSKSKKSRRDKDEKRSLPKELSPVVRLSSAYRDCTPSPVSSEFSGSTMSYDTSSNGMGTPNPESKHQFILPEVDLSERLPNVPDDSVALCILSDLKSSSETWEELYHILETRYGINQDSVYLWHRVIKKHGLLSEHVLHFIADVTENLVEVELERFVQWLLCPSAMALQEKYKKIVDFQEKLEVSIKQTLDHGISKTISKNVRKTCRALTWPISEIIQLGEGYALILLINPKLGRTQELVSLFPLGQSQSWSSSSQMLFSISLNDIQNVSRNVQSTEPTNLQGEILTLKRWCIGEIKAPIQIEVRPVTVEKDILCPEESKDNHRLIPQISSFLSKIFTSSIEGPRTEVLCILDLDSQVVKPESYICSVLAKFMSRSTGKCYMFIDVQSVDLDMLFDFLKSLEEASEKQLEILSLVDIFKVSPTVIVIRASNSSVRETPPSSPEPVHSLKRGCKLEDDSKEGGNKSSTECPSDDNKKSSEQEEDKKNGNDGEDGEIPSTSVDNKLKLRRTGSGNWKTKNSNKRLRSNVRVGVTN